MVDVSQGRRLALVVGVNHAPQSQKAPLRFAEKDAEDLARVLQLPACGFTVPSVWLGEEALSWKIRQALLTLVNSLTDNDLLLIHFALHGVPMKRPDGGDEVLLATSDFDRNNAASDPSSYLPLSWVRDTIYYTAKAGNIVLFLDCCHAAFTAQSPVDRAYLNSSDFTQLRTILTDQFMPRGNALQAPIVGGLRRIFAATSADNTAAEKDGHGVMTGLIIAALQGKEPDARDFAGEVTVARLNEFLQSSMRRMGVEPLDLQGTDANRSCMLARYQPAPRETQGRSALTYFVSHQLSTHFQARPGEFAELLRRLKGEAGQMLGLIGMPGIGKSELAAQFGQAHQANFPDGIYWVNVDTRNTALPHLDFWKTRFAALARKINRRPSPDQNDEETLASFFANFLAKSTQALLILDDVEDPYEITRLLTALAGQPMQCAVLYTSVSSLRPDEASIYRVPDLTSEQAYYLLLPDQRAKTLASVLRSDPGNEEALAARAVCAYLANHPLALTVLRAFLEADPELTLKLVAGTLVKEGFLALEKDVQTREEKVGEMLLMVWDKIRHPDAERLFRLLAYYPDNMAIPLWLAGLAADLSSVGGALSPLHRAWKRLHNLSLVTYLGESQVLQLHPMLREFGKKLTNPEEIQHAGQLLDGALFNLELMAERARLDYWAFLDQFRVAISYIKALTGEIPSRLIPLERAMDRESHLLASGTFWPQRFPALFQQQILNRLSSRDAKNLLDSGPPPHDLWLQMLSRQGSSPDRQRILCRHDREVTLVAFSPDGKDILTASEDGEARILEATSGRILARLGKHADGVTSATFSPDGTLVLTAGRDGEVVLWRWERAFRLVQDMATFHHPAEVSSVAFSANGKSFVSGCLDHLARLWDIETRQIQQTFSGHLKPICCVAFSRDDSQVLTASWDNTARLWNVSTGKEAKVFTWAIKYKFPYTPYFVNPQTEEEIDQPVNEEISLSDRFLTWAAFSPDGASLVISYNDSRIWLWDIASCKVIRAFDHPSVEVATVAFSRDGQFLLTGSGDGGVRVFDVKTGSLQTMLRASGRIRSVAFSPDGKSLLAGSNDHYVRRWQLPAQSGTNTGGEEQATLTFVSQVALGVYTEVIGKEKNSYLKALSGFENGEVWLWEFTGTSLQVKLRTPARNSPVTTLAFSQDCRTFLVGYQDGCTQRWRIPAESPIREFEAPHQIQHDQESTETLYLPDGLTFLTASLDGKADVWTAKAGQEPHRVVTHPVEKSGPITRVAVSPEGHLLLIGLVSGQLILTSSKRHEERLRWQGHTGPITGLAFLPRNRYMLTSGVDTRTYLWDSQDGTRIGELEEQAGDEVRLFAFSPDGRLLLTINNRGSLVRLWTIETGDSPPFFTLRGLYSTPHRVSTALWQNNQVFTLADTGDSSCRPSFYNVRIRNLA